LLLAPAPLLLAPALAAFRVSRQHLLDLLVQPQLLEQRALLAPDLVCDRGRPNSVYFPPIVKAFKSGFGQSSSPSPGFVPRIAEPPQRGPRPGCPAVPPGKP
jgi:hypothetical protein